MAALNRHLHIGIIAEELNDVAVLKNLAPKLIRKRSIKVSPFVGHGCGKLQRKCAAWTRNLFMKGCDVVIVVHDQDRNDYEQLRNVILQILKEFDNNRVLVLIPVEEMEAWLLADPIAIQTVFKMRRKPSIPKNTESINDPKRYLRDLVSRESKSRYLQTIHNEKIAAALNVESLKHLSSFKPLTHFLGSFS